MARAARHWGMEAVGSVPWTCGVCPGTKERGSPGGERRNRACGTKAPDVGVLDRDSQDGLHGPWNKHLSSSAAWLRRSV